MSNYKGEPPKRATQDQAIQIERGAAYIAAQEGGFLNCAVELERFVRHIHTAIELESMDARLIEGD